jgi:IS5 family transposase
LSDPKLEKLLVRGLLFCRFVGLSLADSVPDHSSIWRNRPNKDTDGNNTQDPEASWNVKQGSDGKRKSTYGFKAHANVDEDGFIKATAFTAGNVYDSNHFTDLLSGKESEVYADSAYKSKQHDDWLEDHYVNNMKKLSLYI